MISKLITFSMLLGTLFFSIQATSCTRNRNDEWVTVGGPNVRANIVIFFKKGTTNEQIKEFDKNVLNLEVQPISLIFRVTNGDFVGVGVRFSTDATLEQREQLKKSIQESPVVYKLYENVAPEEIKDLEKPMTPVSLLNTRRLTS